MILTCPDCATRYFVGDDALPPQGRTVRCAACAAQWRALPEGADVPLILEPPPPLPAQPQGESKPVPVASALRAKARAKQETAAAATVGVVWAGLGVGLAALLALAVLFRVEVVRVWPRTAGAYAAVRVPVNPVGLAPEAVQGGPGLQNGRAVMVVSGMLRNVTSGPRPSATLKVSLLDKAGRRLAVQDVQALGGAIGPGEARAFQATFLDPPLSAAQFGVDFAFDDPKHGRRVEPRKLGLQAPHRPARAAATPLHATPVPEARPLSSDSPYALHAPEHG